MTLSDPIFYESLTAFVQHFYSDIAFEGAVLICILLLGIVE